MNSFSVGRRYLQPKTIYIEASSNQNASFLKKHFGQNEGKLLYDEIKSSVSNQDTVSFTTILPWILSDLCGKPYQNSVDIASSWECIVLYARTLDEVTDSPEWDSSSKKRLLAASTLFTHGISQLSLSDPNLDLSSLYEAATFQEKDLTLAEPALNGSLSRIEDHVPVLAGKNIFAQILTSSFSNDKEINKDLINQFIYNLAAFAQIIDDIQDIEEDFHNKSYSHLISLQNEESHSSLAELYLCLLERQLLSESAKVSLKFLDLAKGIVNSMLEDRLPEQTSSKALLCEYLDSLHSQTCTFIEELQHIEERRIANESGLTKKEIERIRKAIKGLLMGT